MSIWIGIILIGLACTVIGYAIFFNNTPKLKSKKPVLLIGIFLPLFFAYTYGETFVSDSSYNLTLIDLGGLLALGIISGILIGRYFLINRVERE